MTGVKSIRQRMDRLGNHVGKDGITEIWFVSPAHGDQPATRILFWQKDKPACHDENAKA